MNPESFHFLYDLVNENPAQAAMVLGMVAFMFALLAAATFGKVPGVVLWVMLAGVFFEFSQVFPENRNQKPQELAFAAVGSAVITIFWTLRVAPKIRKKFRKP